MKRNKLVSRILAFALAVVMVFSNSALTSQAAISLGTNSVPHFSDNPSYSGGGSGGTTTQGRGVATLMAVPILTIAPLENIAKSNAVTVDENKKVLSLKENFSPFTIKGDCAVLVAPFLSSDYVNRGANIDLVGLRYNGIKKGRHGDAETTGEGWQYCDWGNYSTSKYFGPGSKFGGDTAIASTVNVSLLHADLSYTTIGYINNTVDGYTLTHDLVTKCVDYNGKTMSPWDCSRIKETFWAKDENDEAAVLYKGVYSYKAIRDEFDKDTNGNYFSGSPQGDEYSLDRFLWNMDMIETPIYYDNYAVYGGWTTHKSDVVIPLFMNYINQKAKHYFNECKIFTHDLETLDKESPIYREQYNKLLTMCGLQAYLDKPVVFNLSYAVICVISDTADSKRTAEHYNGSVIFTSQADNYTYTTDAGETLTLGRGSWVGSREANGSCCGVSYIGNYSVRSDRQDYYINWLLSYQEVSGHSNGDGDLYAGLYYISNTLESYHDSKGRGIGGVGDKGNLEFLTQSVFKQGDIYANRILADDSIKIGEDYYGLIDTYWNESNAGGGKVGDYWLINCDETSRGAMRGMLMAMTNSKSTGGTEVFAQKNAIVQFSRLNYADYIANGIGDERVKMSEALGQTAPAYDNDKNGNKAVTGKAVYNYSGLSITAGSELPNTEKTNSQVINTAVLIKNQDPDQADKYMKYLPDNDGVTTNAVGNNKKAGLHAFNGYYNTDTIQGKIDAASNSIDATKNTSYKLATSMLLTDVVDKDFEFKQTNKADAGLQDTAYGQFLSGQIVSVGLEAKETFTGKRAIGSRIGVSSVQATPGGSLRATAYKEISNKKVVDSKNGYLYSNSANMYWDNGEAVYNKTAPKTRHRGAYVVLDTKDYELTGINVGRLSTSAAGQLTSAERNVKGTTDFLFRQGLTQGATITYDSTKDATNKVKIEVKDDKAQRVVTQYNVYASLPKVYSALYTVDTQWKVDNGKFTATLGTPKYVSKTSNYSIEKSSTVYLPEKTVAYVAVPLAWFLENKDFVGNFSVEVTKANNKTWMKTLLNQMENKGLSGSGLEYNMDTGTLDNAAIITGASQTTSGGFAIIAILNSGDIETYADVYLYSYQINNIYPDVEWLTSGMEHFITTESNNKNIYKMTQETRECWVNDADQTSYTESHHSHCTSTPKTVYYTKNRWVDNNITAYKDIVESSNATYHQKVEGYRSDADKAKYMIYSRGFKLEKEDENGNTLTSYVGGNFNYSDKIEGINFNMKWVNAANNKLTMKAKSGDSYRYGVGTFSYGINLTRKDFDDVKTISTITNGGGVPDADYLKKVVDYAGGGQGNKPSDKYLKITTYNKIAKLDRVNTTLYTWTGDYDSVNNDGLKREIDPSAVSECEDAIDGEPVKFNSGSVPYISGCTDNGHNPVYVWKDTDGDGKTDKQVIDHYTSCSIRHTSSSFTDYDDAYRYVNVPSHPSPDFSAPDKYIYKYIYYKDTYNFAKIRETGSALNQEVFAMGGIIPSTKATLELKEYAEKYMPDDKGVKESTKEDEIIKNTLGKDTTYTGTMMFRDAVLDDVTLMYYPEVQMRYYINTNDDERDLYSQDDVVKGTVKVMGDVKRQSKSSGLYIYSVNNGYENQDIIDYGNKKTINDYKDRKPVKGVTVSSGYQTSQENGKPIMYAGSDVTINANAEFTINLYGYMVDVVNKDVDDKTDRLVSAALPSIQKGNLPTTEKLDVKLATLNYNTIVHDNSDVYTDWGNTDSSEKLFEEYKDWTKTILDVKKYKAQFELDIDNGGKKYNDFNSTFGKFAVVKDGKVGKAFNKDNNNKEDGVFSLNIENGQVVKFVKPEGSTVEYYDTKYLALLIQIADDANISLAEADKMFDESDLQNSIMEAIQSSTDDYNKSKSSDFDFVPELQLGNEPNNWYDEKVKTIVIRRYVTDSVTPSGIVLNDKIDYNAIDSKTSSSTASNKAVEAKWNFSFEFDVTDTNMKNKITDNKLIVIGKQHIDGADFKIKNSSEDSGD